MTMPSPPSEVRKRARETLEVDTGDRKAIRSPVKVRRSVDAALPTASNASSAMEPATPPLPSGKGRKKGSGGSGSRPRTSYEHVVLDEALQTQLYLEKLRSEEGEDGPNEGRASSKEYVGNLLEPRVDVSQLMAGRMGVLHWTTLTSVLPPPVRVLEFSKPWCMLVLLHTQKDMIKTKPNFYKSTLRIGIKVLDSGLVEPWDLTADEAMTHGAVLQRLACHSADVQRNAVEQAGGLVQAWGLEEAFMEHVRKENARHNRRDDPAQFVADLNRLLADQFMPQGKGAVLPWRVVGIGLDSIWGMVEQQEYWEAMGRNADRILEGQGRRGVFRGRQAKSSFRAFLKGIRDEQARKAAARRRKSGGAA